MDVTRYPRLAREGHAVTGDRSKTAAEVSNPLGHDYLEASSHCPRVRGGCLEERLVGGNHLDSEAFSASLADVDGG